MSKRTFLYQVCNVFAVPVIRMQGDVAVFQNVYVHLYNVVSACALAVSAGLLYMFQSHAKIFKFVWCMCECKAVEEFVRLYAYRFGPYAFSEYDALSEHAAQHLLCM